MCQCVCCVGAIVLNSVACKACVWPTAKACDCVLSSWTGILLVVQNQCHRVEMTMFSQRVHVHRRSNAEIWRWWCICIVYVCHCALVQSDSCYDVYFLIWGRMKPIFPKRKSMSPQHTLFDMKQLENRANNPRKTENIRQNIMCGDAPIIHKFVHNLFGMR